jgi:hypothetical protein
MTAAYLLDGDYPESPFCIPWVVLAPLAVSELISDADTMFMSRHPVGRPLRGALCADAEEYGAIAVLYADLSDVASDASLPESEQRNSGQPSW